jgi:heme/copper-type cytochrome/quinol oxidase subunit 2
MNFKDPVSTFAYNLISLHHDIMWYIIIILTLVYWSLYKIIKEYSWSYFNKQEGFLSLLNSTFLFKIQRFIMYLWLNFFILNILYFFIKIFYWLVEKLDSLFLKSKKTNFHKMYERFIIFILGRSYFTGLHWDYENYLQNINLETFDAILLDRFFSHYLYNAPSNALLFNEGFDDVLSTLKFRHSINLEYVFGMFPTVIIVFIIVPSMYLLYSNETDINPSLTVKVVGHQWYWSYEGHNVYYVNDTNDVISLSYNFDSVIINETDLVKGGLRLLETDTSLVLPYNVVIRFLITSSDVLHSWALPEMGIKVDAVPGRLNQVVTVANNLGLFYGQCSELCGVSHGFMPIKVNVISLSDYYNLVLNK